MEKGYVHVYTGNGKGKSTSAFGLALRAAGAGKRVYIGQFLKSDAYHEIKAFRQYLPMVTVVQYGNGRCLVTKETLQEADYTCAADGLEHARAALCGGQFDVVILDEINIAVCLQLVDEQEVLSLLQARPPQVELILTGRYATPRLLEQADLVTEMAEIKHYYTHGVLARDGIER